MGAMESYTPQTANKPLPPTLDYISVSYRRLALEYSDVTPQTMAAALAAGTAHYTRVSCPSELELNIADAMSRNGFRRRGDTVTKSLVFNEKEGRYAKMMDFERRTNPKQAACREEE